jgi:hypothetical protein
MHAGCTSMCALAPAHLPGCLQAGDLHRISQAALHVFLSFAADATRLSACLQIFNLVVSRRINDEYNFFKGLHRSTLFLIILAIIVFCQVGARSCCCALGVLSKPTDVQLTFV